MPESYNKAIKFNKMVKDKSNDELGLFEKYDEILSEIRNRIFNYNAKDVIDIGCGTGNLCGELSENLNVLGIDQNLEMISYASAKYPKMNFKLGSFLDRPSKINNADIVVTTYALHGLNDTEKETAIKNMLEYLKDNGKIIIADFMFQNNIEKQKCKDNLCAIGKQDLWDFINSKHYTNLERLQNYIHSLGYKFYSQHIVNFTWITEISAV